jgi:hypothetical protein
MTAVQQPVCVDPVATGSTLPTDGTWHRWRDPYLQAAAGYVGYGLVYLGGAIARLTPDRKVTFLGVVPWWALYVLGAALILVLPWVIVRWRPWPARILALGPMSKAFVLCWRLARGSGGAFDVAFALVAVAASALLLRAGLSRRRRA